MHLACAVSHLLCSIALAQYPYTGSILIPSLYRRAWGGNSQHNLPFLLFSLGLIFHSLSCAIHSSLPLFSFFLRPYLSLYLGPSWVGVGSWPLWPIPGWLYLASCCSITALTTLVIADNLGTVGKKAHLDVLWCCSTGN